MSFDTGGAGDGHVNLDLGGHYNFAVTYPVHLRGVMFNVVELPCLHHFEVRLSLIENYDICSYRSAAVNSKVFTVHQLSTL